MSITTSRRLPQLYHGRGAAVPPLPNGDIECCDSPTLSLSIVWHGVNSDRVASPTFEVTERNCGDDKRKLRIAVHEQVDQFLASCALRPTCVRAPTRGEAMQMRSPMLPIRASLQERRRHNCTFRVHRHSWPRLWKALPNVQLLSSFSTGR